MEKEFTELIYQNQGILHKICNLYFGSSYDKEDYKQEIIIQLWKAFPGFKKQSKFSTWMYRVCLNAAIDITRKLKSYPKLIKFEKQMASHASENENITDSNQEKLYSAIQKLSEVDKAIITLYLEEFSYKEIAEIVGISESNTGVKINRIKSEIIKIIENGNK